MKVAVIAAHPDDEVLGCGATMAKHVAQGDDVHVLIMATGITSRANNTDNTGLLTQLDQAMQDAAERLGVTSITKLHYPDNQLDTIARLQLVQSVESFLEQCQASCVYTHHAGDVNIDHQCVHHAVVTACRPLPGQQVTRLLFFEAPSSSEWQPPSSGAVFAPNYAVDITHFLDKKLSALQAYEMEMRDWPHSRSYDAVTALARWRGASFGHEAVEAFMLGRWIQR